MNLLCERHEAIGFEAKVIKEYTLKDHLNKLFNDKILRGDQSNFSGIIEALNFDGNQKAISRSYEQHVLSVGDIDERIFLGMFTYLFVCHRSRNSITKAGSSHLKNGRSLLKIL